MKRIIIALLCLCMLSGCAPRLDKKDGKIQVVATIFPIYDFVRAVGGDRVECRMLIDAGTEVHSFDPTPSDVKAVYNADLMIYIGGESDKWVDLLLRDVNVNCLALMPAVEEKCELSHSHHHRSHTHGADEHIWTSPMNATVMIEEIAENLSETDPEGADYYNKNSAAYISQIEAVSDEIQSVVSKADEPFIVVADRFPFLYFAEEFGIKYEAAFGGCAVSADISLKVMRRLTQTVEQKNIGYIYSTEMSGKNIANALSEETGAEILELHSAHNVTLDDFKSGITYLDIMKNNAAALRKGWGL